MILFDDLKKVGSSLLAKSVFLMMLCLACLGQVTAQNVAKIGDIHYTTLDAAVDAVQANETIEILADSVGITNTKVIPANVTITGQGKTATKMTIISSSGSGITINNPGVTLKKMTIDGSQITSDEYKTLVNVKADNVLIDSVIMTKGGISTWNSSILVETLPSTATFTVSNSTISGSFRGVLRESCNANIVITNCDITATYPFNIDGGNGGTVTVTNGSLHGWTSYGGVDQVTFNNVEFSMGNSGYNNVAAYVNTTFDNCTLNDNIVIYAQASGFTFEFNDCTNDGVPVTTENFTELFPSDPNVWNACVTVVNDVILVGTQTKLDNAAASGPANVSTRMTKSFEYDGNLCPNITSLIVNGDNGGDSTLTFSNCTFGSTTTPATLTLAGGEYTLSATCSNGCNVTLEHVAIVLGENASFTVNGQTDFFKPAQYYIIKETANGNGTYTYSTQYVGVATIGETGYPTLNAAAAAVPVGTPTTITILQNLNFYDIAASNLSNKIITFTGTPTDTLTLTDASHKTTAAGSSDLTFENITLKNDDEEYGGVDVGIIHSSKVSINKCEVIGFMKCYPETFICDSCTFTKTAKYHLWTYSSNCTFNNCTFNSYNNGDCKAINVYWNEVTDPYRVMAFNDCAFNSIPAVTTHKNSAIQINSQYTCFVLYVNNCTVDGYINNSSTAVPKCPNLVNNKKEVPNTKTTLYLDGVQILKEGSCDPVAKIGDTYYNTLQDALDAAHGKTGDVIIDIVSDSINTYSIVHQKAGLNVTIEGNNHKVAGQIFIDGNGRASGTETLTIQNINFRGDKSHFYSGTDAFILVPSTKDESKPWSTGAYNYAHNVTVSNCDFTSTSSSLNVVGLKATSGAGLYNLVMSNGKGDNLHSFAQLTATTGATITNDTVTNSKSFVNVSGGASNHSISGCDFTSTGDSEGYGIRMKGSSSATITLSDNKFETDVPIWLGESDSPVGTIKVESGMYISTAASLKAVHIDLYDTCTVAKVVLTGGTFSCDVTDKCATGYGCYKNVEGYPAGWTVLKMYEVAYNGNGATSGSMKSTYLPPFGNQTFSVKANDPDQGDGYTWEVYFLNWNTKANGSGTTFDPDTEMTVNSDTVLYAQWDCVATIGNTPYGTLQAAIDYANANMTGDVTIKLLKNTSEVVQLLEKMPVSIAIDGQGNTLTGQLLISSHYKNGTDEYLGNIYTDPNTVLIENLNFKYDEGHFLSVTSGNPLNGDVDGNGLITFCKDCVFGGDKNYAHNVTIRNCNFDGDGSNYGIFAITAISGSVYRLTIDGCYATKVLGLAELQSAKQYTVNNCTTENVKWGLHLIASEGPHTISNNNIQADNRAVNIAWYTNNDAINFSNNTMTADTVFAIPTTTTACNLNITSGTYIGAIENATTVDAFNISGGTYSEDVSGQPCAPGYAAFDNHDGTWTVAQAWFLYYDKNEVDASGTMDTVAVRRDADDAGRTVTVAACDFTWLPVHTFDKWNTKANGEGTDVAVGSTMTLTSDTTLYALWKDGYTVFYHNNGGTGTIANQSKIFDETITLSDGTGFSREGHTLYRWNTQADGNGTNYALGATYGGNDNLDLYAVWRLNLNMTSTATDVVCYGQNNGTDTVKIIGGEAPYQIVLSGGALTDNVKVTTDQTTHIFTDLKPSANAYKVQLTDVLTKDTIRTSFTISQPDTLVITAITVPERPCPLMGTGTYAVSMTTNGGNGGNTITWSGDATDANALATTITPDADDRDRTYNVTVTVTDSKGCMATGNASFSVAPVIANDGSAHSNTTMTIAPISKGILTGCDTIIRDFGTPAFVFTNPDITGNILDTIYNNVSTVAPDSIFAVGTHEILWTAIDTCGHIVTATQTLEIFYLPCPTVTDYDGNSYRTVRIACDCWMAENLRSNNYEANRPIPNVMHYSARTRAIDYNGNLYDWYATMDAGENGTNSVSGIEAAYAAGESVRGVCPEGWHVPTEAEVEALMAAYSPEELMAQGVWIPDNGTNASGFNMLPSGIYNDVLNRYESKYVNGYFWILTPPTSVYHACEFGSACSTTELIPGSLKAGYSVRCVIDKE